ncbi:pentapeptide repeat-containing protein [Actinokineospora sp. UTMC 2448]|uniref:pentapeptide repeat-containing protein n=1 Tax=Actinokineospora sp. UTMC 2448 TaxID=2268449 RepID=UPI0021642518|nr:pentapeptide repeat-containing protein [Actinokineospora sp. UTMC 2448]
MTSSPVPQPERPPAPMRPPSKRAVAAAVGGVVVVVGGLLALLWSLVEGGSPQAPTQLELVRIGLTVLLGTGGLFGLYLAWRRQRSTEIALAQKQQDQADVARAYELQRETAETTRHDAEARRITELYTKAVEQLGSDKAPVRLGGLYALERLAQDHGEQRQTIVNVLCAYLRMPYTPPDNPPVLDDITDPAVRKELIAEHREQVQEREVRLAAQRILARHLHPGDNPDNPVETFWTGIDVDLTNATLTDLDLSGCIVHTTSFRGATFIDEAWFSGVTFTGNVISAGAIFTGSAIFTEATFGGAASFRQATFTDVADFDRATFTRQANFAGVAFTDVYFSGATFTGNAVFGGATFTGRVGFVRATFTRGAVFRGATLPSTRYAGRNTPSPWTRLEGARFAGGVPAELAEFMSAPEEEAVKGTVAG